MPCDLSDLRCVLEGCCGTSGRLQSASGKCWQLHVHVLPACNSIDWSAVQLPNAAVSENTRSHWSRLIQQLTVVALGFAGPANFSAVLSAHCCPL